MGKFDGMREELLEYLSTADGEEYDTVYYFIGERDYDRSDPETVGKVADYFIEKSSSTRQYPYRNNNPITEGDRVYKDGEGAPEEMQEFIERRRARVLEAEKDGMTYIPYGNRFDSLMCQVIFYGGKTEEEAEAFDNSLKDGTYSLGGIKSKPAPTTFEVVLVIVVGILVLFSLIAEGMY